MRTNLADVADWLLIPEEIRRQVETVGRCIVWTGRRNRYQRGVVQYGGRTVPVEKAVFASMNGLPPAGRKVLQVCSNVDCLRPSHLAMGWPLCKAGLHELCPTNCDVGADGGKRCRACRASSRRVARVRKGPLKPSIAEVNARKRSCPAGHLYDEANTYLSPKGWRVCRACARERDRARRDAKRRAASTMPAEDREWAERHSSLPRDPAMTEDWPESPTAVPVDEAVRRIA